MDNKGYMGNPTYRGGNHIQLWSISQACKRMAKPIEAAYQRKSEGTDDDKKNDTTETKPEKSFELPGFKHNPIPNKEELY